MKKSGGVRKLKTEEKRGSELGVVLFAAPITRHPVPELDERFAAALFARKIGDVRFLLVNVAVISVHCAFHIYTIEPHHYKAIAQIHATNRGKDGTL